ncbi:hypothetical protein NC796_03315 [Aliifodinibius sp. S!AR15-10]|uniref:hypothetical protein n=1 Tax=Aliifodinibius sp. S!AR15-10 TaxID=2950437 RepID=UPI00285DF754|nr:hypothetical protein [Aliifodinibius sp. S!AR15-10]MDR8390155.1 hypothetical protein [Aliifodinibius sp. S!AR15-10]
MDQITCNNCGESFPENDLEDENKCPHCGKDVDHYSIKPDTGYYELNLQDVTFWRWIKEYGKIARIVGYILSILVFTIGILDVFFLKSGEIWGFIIYISLNNSVKPPYQLV